MYDNRYSQYSVIESDLKYCVWIDDDGDTLGMNNIVRICEKNDIKCTFALITNMLEDSACASYYHKLYDKGFDLAMHTSHSQKWFDDKERDFIAKDIKNSIKTFDKIGFMSDVIVYPYGCYQEWIDSEFGNWLQIGFGTTKKRYKKGGTQYNIGRYFLKKDESVGNFKKYVDYCEYNGFLLCIGTHSAVASWNNEFDENYINDCISYIKARGYTFVTVHEYIKAQDAPSK